MRSAIQSSPFVRPEVFAPAHVRQASLKDLSNRLKTVTNMRKITKAMKMVAASKLRGAESRLMVARPFAAGSKRVMADAATGDSETETEGKHMVVAISSDKGLCGGINSVIVKATKQIMANDEEAQIFLVGSKARDGLVRQYKKNFSMVMDEVYTKPPSFSLASLIAEKLLEEDYRSIDILYNKFKSVIVFNIDTVSLPPKSVVTDSSEGLDKFEFEGDRAMVMGDLYEFYVAVQLYHCILENMTSEQASRMTAMDNATNNSGEVINQLQIKYNRGRQAKITSELCEIIAGAEAV